ncbi:MAG: hypothetical protein NXI03_00370 [Alphaproteobacteria bacterium]|uniref:hypothetical protein n=1 Tax=Maricaulis alexandrii TaxID=2570354 RepID=UPI0011095EC2|nr:hypothetical protein [Maricaulis alexandrii]MCR9266004.1 hypothetical protein [Alphaproteobacteria bacterium]
MPITPPAISTKRLLARKLLDAVVGEVPLVGGPLAALYSVTHPAKGDIQFNQWVTEITALVNSLEQAIKYVSQSITLSEEAASFGLWIAQQSESGGRFDLLSYDHLVENFECPNGASLSDLVGELELEGMLRVSKCLGKPFSSVRPSHKLFETFDPVIFDEANPRSDAAQIVQRYLTKEEDAISASKLAEDFGWLPRRLNPALAIIADYIGERRISAPMGQPYVARVMFPDISERIALKRLVQSVQGDQN